MAALDPANTVRFFLDYTDGINEHTLMARVSGANLATAMSQVDTFLDELSPTLHLITVLGARLAAEGSNVTNPVTWSGNSTYGTGAMAPENAPRELRFIGRSVDGRRCSVSVYGFAGATPADYRVDVTENAAVDDAVLRLANATALGVFVGISKLAVVWKPYASFNFNSYWEKEARP